MESQWQYQGYALENIQVSGITEDENNIQPVTIEFGRYISSSEFAYGTPVCMIGFDNAELLFGNAQNAVGKEVKIKGNKAGIIGVLKKMGQNAQKFVDDQPNSSELIFQKILKDYQM